ncbi:MAG: response regulator [Gammaproteobacteria bacterium]|nr:response regulator [Gammaproteobacteria bacterium]
MALASLHRILYVEDEPDIQAVAKLALETIGGYTLEICSSGSEAVAKGPDFAPDLILMDVMMPDLDGPATLQELRKNSTLINTPMIFMTAKVLPDEISELKKLGAIDVIAKPFDPMTLSQVINDIWQQQAA